MPRRFFKKILPDPNKIKNASYMRPLKSFADNRQLWTTRRRNVVVGLAIGLFCGFQPIPAHTMLAVALAIWLRANLPMAVVATLFNNPVTLFPMYYLGYKIGCIILGVPDLSLPPDASKIDWIKELIATSWQPLFLGCFVTGLFFALVGSVGLNEFWKWNTKNERKKRLFAASQSARLQQKNINKHK